MYEIEHISNMTGDLQVMISLKKLEDILEELYQLRKHKQELNTKQNDISRDSIN